MLCYNFSHVFDLQNSKRTSFYRKYLLKAAIWSSTETILKKGERKEDFDNDQVGEEMLRVFEVISFNE